MNSRDIDFGKLFAGIDTTLRDVIRARAVPIRMIPDLGPRSFDLEKTLAEHPGLEGDTKADSDSVRGALRFFLGHQLRSAPEPPLSIAAFSRIIPPLNSIIYWAELDLLRRDIKATAFTFVSRNIQAALNSTDRSTVSFYLRQAIEATWWALYCSYGAQVACSTISKTLAENKVKAISIISETTEAFLRGWFAPDKDAISAGLTATNRPDTYKHPTDFVEENDTLGKKMRFVARFWATQVDNAFNQMLAKQIDQTARIYEYTSKLVHVTPLLVTSWFPSKFVDPVSSVSLIRATAISLFQLQKQLLFHDRWADTSFLTIIGPHLSSASITPIIIEIPVIEQLRHARKPVEIALDDGSLIPVFPKHA